MSRLLAVLLVAAVKFPNCLSFSKANVDKMKDPFVKSLTQYLVDFPKTVVAAWQDFAVRTLSLTDTGKLMSVYADQVNNPGAVGSCATQAKDDYDTLKAGVISSFQTCACVNEVRHDAFDKEIENAIKGLASVDNDIQTIVNHCRGNGISKDRCEALNKQIFMTLRMQGRTNKVMPVHKLAYVKMADSAIRLSDCFAKNTTGIYKPINDNIDRLYKCMSLN